jgi:hypothetical protein
MIRKKRLILQGLNRDSVSVEELLDVAEDSAVPAAERSLLVPVATPHFCCGRLPTKKADVNSNLRAQKLQMQSNKLKIRVIL